MMPPFLSPCPAMPSHQSPLSPPLIPSSNSYCRACRNSTGCAVVSKQPMCRFTLELDAIKWHLCQDRTPFVAASIAGVMLDSIQNKDLSGEHLTRGRNIPKWTLMSQTRSLWHDTRTCSYSMSAGACTH